MWRRFSRRFRWVDKMAKQARTSAPASAAYGRVPQNDAAAHAKREMPAFAAMAFALAIALAFVTIMLLAAASVPSTHFAEPLESTGPRDVTEPVTFMVISDAQMTVENATAQKHLSRALTCVASVEPSFLVFNGDLVDNGWHEQYDLCRKLFAEAGVDFNATYFAMGNHEKFLYARDGSEEAYEKKVARFVEECDVPSLYYDEQTDAGHLIVLGSDANVQSDPWTTFRLSNEELAWLDQLLAEDEENCIPSFVFLHEPLNNTTGFTESGELKYNDIAVDAELRAVFERHPNVVFVSGHTHTLPQVVQPFGESGALAVNDSAIAYTRQGVDASTGPTSSCGMQVVVEGNAVTFIPWDFATGEPLAGQKKTYFFDYGK